MTYRAASALALTLAAAMAPAGPAAAANLPQIKATPSNSVPACVTPGRLMAFVQMRNGKLDSAFDGIATEYMRHGEALRIRWDYAFFQMLVETGNLSFKGDVKPRQNNFAGLGATGGGEPGESFQNVSTGARAHLEHVLMYSGEYLEAPVAERTRKVQEWGVLKSWQKSIKGPMTFAHLTRKWSPGDRGYARDIASVADSFFDRVCKSDDPRPELAAEARGSAPVKAAQAEAVAPKQVAPQPVATTSAEPPSGKGSGAEIARRAVEEARQNGENQRLSLGAASLAGQAKAPVVKILNAPKPDADAATAPSSIEPLAAVPPPAARPGVEKPASAKDAQKAADAAAAASASACRVWQAGYGGEKAVIIKAAAGAETNYTVLDVNEGEEKREADAYIAAYAKGGQTVGEFTTSTQALEKAFELCPEG